MRIVSQNRNVSVEFGNGMIKVDGPYIFFNTEQSEEILGLYTPERAREVFEDIHTAYNPLNNLDFTDGTPKRDKIPQFITTVSSVGDVDVILNSNFVYYMPEE